jgi:hypothetical protein
MSLIFFGYSLLSDTNPNSPIFLNNTNINSKIQWPSNFIGNASYSNGIITISINYPIEIKFKHTALNSLAGINSQSSDGSTISQINPLKYNGSQFSINEQNNNGYRLIYACLYDIPNIN